MRGTAVLLAAGAVWIGVTGLAPRFTRRWRPDPRAAVGVLLVASTLVTAVMVATGIPVVAVAAGVVGSLLPLDRSLRRASERSWTRLRAWPDILARVRSGLASGSPVEESLIDAVSRCGPEFTGLATALERGSIFGDGIVAALDDPDVAIDPSTRRILVTLSIASTTGGHRVGAVVGALSRSVADDIRLREAHRAALTEQRLTVGVALVAPWVMLVLAVATNPQAGVAFGTVGGSVVVVIGMVATVVGWALAQRTARISSPPEVFTCG